MRKVLIRRLGSLVNWVIALLSSHCKTRSQMRIVSSIISKRLKNGHSAGIEQLDIIRAGGRDHRMLLSNFSYIMKLQHRRCWGSRPDAGYVRYCMGTRNLGELL